MLQMENTCKRHSKCLKKEESLNKCNKKLQTLPNSILSDLTELSHLKRDQMIDNKQYQIMQFGIEERARIDNQNSNAQSGSSSQAPKMLKMIDCS